MRRLTIVFHDAGGGHRSSAEALKATLTSQHQPWDVCLLNIQELLDSIDVIRKCTGIRIQEGYNLVLRKGWTRFSPQLLVVLRGLIRIFHGRIVRVLQAYWAQHPTDLVLSVIPHFNRPLAESLRNPETGFPFVTLLTDFADYPPHFWIERESEFLIVGTERARQQALEMGHPAERIFLTSGMVLKPRFYEPVTTDRVAERKRHGLEPDCPTGIVLFGGHGSRVMLDIVQRLNDSGVQLILLCGHNQDLAAALKKIPTKKPMLVQGFTPNVEYFMSFADFFIGKPGPGSISEALQFHLPVIVECNAKTLPQERYNAQWVTENRCGMVVDSFRNIAASVHRLLEDATFAEFRRNAGSYSNHALFEVSAILDKCANLKSKVQHDSSREANVVLRGAEKTSLQSIELKAPAQSVN